MLPGQCHSPEDATDVGGSTGRIKRLKPCKNDTIIIVYSRFVPPSIDYTSEIRSDV